MSPNEFRKLIANGQTIKSAGATHNMSEKQVRHLLKTDSRYRHAYEIAITEREAKVLQKMNLAQLKETYDNEEIDNDVPKDLKDKLMYVLDKMIRTNNITASTCNSVAALVDKINAMETSSSEELKARLEALELRLGA